MKFMVGVTVFLALGLAGFMGYQHFSNRPDPLDVGSAAAPIVEGGWTHNYNQAISRARATGRPIFADFTGSDWCPPCIALKKQVFDSPEFKSWAKDRGIILLELDFPKRKSQDSAIKRQNATLAQSLGVRSFPTIMLLDGSGKPLGGRISGYGGQDPEAWIARAEVTWANALDS